MNSDMVCSCSLHMPLRQCSFLTRNQKLMRVAG